MARTAKVDAAPGYLVTDQGQVLGKSGRPLSPSKDKDGYLRPGLQTAKGQRSFFVHRLVAEAFIPNPNNLPQVNHINGVKTDNRVENLEWCTAKSNTRHADATGLRENKAKGEVQGSSKLTSEQILSIRKDQRTQSDIATDYGIGQDHVSRIKSRQRWGWL